MKSSIITIFLMLFCIHSSLSQSFEEIRQLALKGDYDSSLFVCETAIKNQPNNLDLKLLYARVLSWSGNTRKSIAVLEELNDEQGSNLTVITLLSTVNYWNNDYAQARSFIQEALQIDSISRDHRFLEFKIMMALKEYKNAHTAIKELLQDFPQDVELKKALIDLQSILFNKSVGIRYLTTNNPLNEDKWLSYQLFFKSKTEKGTWLINYGRIERLDANDQEIRFDVYPIISKKTYGFLNSSISEGTLFPQFRFGCSIFRELGPGVEAQLGYRHLSFTENPANVYLISVGKYIKSFWFTYTFEIIRSSKNLAAHSINTRFYFQNDRSFFFLRLGSGSNQFSGQNSSFTFVNSEIFSNKNVFGGIQYYIPSRFSIEFYVGWESGQQNEYNNYNRNSQGITLTYHFK